MPRKIAAQQVPWKYRGHSVGFVRAGVYYIMRTIGGRRVRLTTGCVTEAAALEEYKRFELNPAGYINRYGKPALPKGRDPARAEQLRINHMARRYKITTAEYERLLMLQGGKCAICGARPSRRPPGRPGR